MSNTNRHNSGKSSVKKEIFRSSTLFSLIIVAVFGLFLSINLYFSELAKAYSVINRTNHGVVFFIEGYFTEVINTISVLADNREIREGLTLENGAHRRILELFKSFSKANKNISYIYSGYENGLMLINDWTAPDGFDPAARPWYQAAMETKPETSIGLPYREIKTREWLVSTSRALKGLDGKYRGVVAVDCSIDQIAGFLRRHYEYDTTYSYVVGKDGKIILHHDESLLGESFPEITKAVQKSSHGNLTYRLGSVRKLAHYKTVPLTGWTVVTAVERNEIIFPVIRRVLGLIGVTGLIAVILGFVQSVIMDKRISRPVVELSRKVKAVIAGEDYRDDYTYPDNEIGFMAQEVGRLAASEFYKKTIELRISEEQFKALFLESPVSILIHDKDTGKIVDANKIACSAYGFSSLEQLQDNEFWLDPPYSLEDALGWIRKAAIEGTQHFEWMNRKVTGEIFWEHVSLRCVTVKGVERMLATSVDITERKQAEEALRESEERFRTAMENLPAGLFIHDMEGRLLLINKAASLNTGYSLDELMALSVGDIDRGEMTPSEREKMWFDLSQGRTIAFESFHLRKDGSLYPVEIHLNPTTMGGKPAILALANDITERKHAEEEREKLQAQLTQAQKMESVGRLAGGVAHDFNNMLGIILGHTDMALEYLDLGQPVHSDLLEIRKATNRSADLVRQLLAFARKQTIAPKVLDLNDTVEGMLKMLRRLIGEDIDLAWMPGKKLWPVNMDPTQIDQILANLCVNARDAIDGIGKVMIETENVTLDEDFCVRHAGSAQGDYVLLAVSDDGCGMDKETLTKLFEPFFTTKEVGKGTGLGLPMIYGIVKQNEGFIDVYSELDHGTTFRIYIPRHIGEGKKEQKQAAGISLVGGHETVLLVEDEPMLLQMGKEMLERLGYRVIAAGSPSEALRIAADHKEDLHLLITDVIMPGMNGLELANQLSATYPNIKLIFMSGYTAEVIAHHGVLGVGVKFVQKPFSMKDLATRIREALES